jgi:hypothetical protein
MALMATGLVLNGLLLVMPAVRAATVLAEASRVAERLLPGYRHAYLMESVAGGVNVALALVAMIAGVIGRGTKQQNEPPEQSPAQEKPLAD